MPIHYVSKALRDAETIYYLLEELIYALIISAGRLRPYFEAHTIYVVTGQPLKQVIRMPDGSGRMEYGPQNSKNSTSNTSQ